VVVRAGKNACNKRTNQAFVAGEEVTVEEMFWCGQCKPCADGYPNQCEQLNEIGFNINGGYTKYIVVPSRVVWSLNSLKKRYSGKNLFLAGSLVEPTCVAYNAVIECGGGVRPGDFVVICGGGPIGLAACAILKRNGAAKVILSETVKERSDLGLKMGADYIINPAKEDFTKRVLEITDGMGANLYLEATGLPTAVYPGIEQAVWQGKTIAPTIVVVARADAKMPVTGEVLQVKKARIVGAQGHSGYGTFPRVIESMAAGMDMTPLITKQIKLEEVAENIINLRTNRTDCKITYVAD
jgi:threonine dehydrogenase-like Zn-dependent dehydrogenase